LQDARRQCRGRKLGFFFIRRVHPVFDRWRNSSLLVPGFALCLSARRNRGDSNNQTRGFSLIELLIAMAIMATISAIAIPHLVSALDSAKLTKAVGDITSIETDIVGYESVYGVLPDTLAQIGDDTLLDPWKNPYQYLNHETMHGNGHARKDRFLVPLNSDYDLYSMGKDGQSAPPITAAPSQDDVIRVGSSNYVGLASQY
jgi:general secretion pathway protein G